MNRLILIIGLGILIYSCSKPTQQETVKNNAITAIKERLDNPKSFEFVEIKFLDSVTYQDNIEYRKRKQKNDSAIMEVIKDIESKLENKQSAASYTYLVKYRCKNALNAIVTNEIIVQTNPDLSILNLANDMDKVLLNPNDFPNYRERVKELQK